MKKSLLNLLHELVFRFKKYFIVLVIVLLLNGVVAAASVLTLAPLADYLLDPSLVNPGRITKFVISYVGNPGILFFALLFILSNVIKSFFEVAIRYTILRIKYAVLRELIGDTLKTILNARWTFFISAGKGTLMNTFQREAVVVGDSMGHLATLLATFLQLLIYLSIPFLLNAQITLVAFAVAVLLGLPFLMVNRLSYTLGKKNTETANEAMGVMQETLGGAKLILSYARQTQELRRYLNVFDNHVRATLHSQTLASAVKAFYQPVGIVAAIVALLFAIERGIPLAEVAAILWSLLKALPMIGLLIEGRTTIYNFLPSYEQLQDLRNKAACEKDVSGKKIFTELSHALTLNKVDFSYPERSNILQNVDIVVEKDKMVALVGESGAGKSTVADLLLGLLKPEHGNVSIDNFPLAEWDISSFRSQLGYVPQDPFLFHTTIRDNLLWSCMEDVPDEKIWEVCKIANADKFIMDLPSGLDTFVGDRGVRLSGGQRQRLALARALMRSPEILILDEATSALDTESELLIQKSIEQVSKNTTIVAIAHRLSTIIKADIIYVMSAGRVVQQGSYAELMLETNGNLAKMVSAQQL